MASGSSGLRAASLRVRRGVQRHAVAFAVDDDRAKAVRSERMRRLDDLAAMCLDLPQRFA